MRVCVCARVCVCVVFLDACMHAMQNAYGERVRCEARVCVHVRVRVRCLHDSLVCGVWCVVCDDFDSIRSDAVAVAAAAAAHDDCTMRSVSSYRPLHS